MLGRQSASSGRPMRPWTLWAVLALCLGAAGCASSGNQEAAQANDPLEPMNRFFFDFNQKLDRNAALPAASFYADNVPRGVRGNVHNFLVNLGGPVDVANDILIGEFGNAGEAGGRFVINTTVGRGRASSTSPPIGACPKRAAISARRWASMACRRDPIWCCPCADPVRSGISLAAMWTAISRRSISCITPAAPMSGWSIPPWARWTTAPPIS